MIKDVIRLYLQEILKTQNRGKLYEQDQTSSAIPTSMSLSDILDATDTYLDKVWSSRAINVEVRTYGDLQALLKGVKNMEGTKLAKKLITSVVASFLPGVATTGFEMLKALYYNKKPVKAGSIVDKLTVDTYTAAIVDDAVEKQFLQEFYKYIMKQDPNKKLPDHFTVDKVLDMYLQNKYANRHVTIS